MESRVEEVRDGRGGCFTEVVEEVFVEVVSAPFGCVLAGMTVKDGEVALSACDAKPPVRLAQTAVTESWARTNTTKVIDERMRVLHHPPALLVRVDAHADLEPALLVLPPLRMLIQRSIRILSVRLSLFDRPCIWVAHLGSDCC
jgi:hypothetical protein